MALLYSMENKMSAAPPLAQSAIVQAEGYTLYRDDCLAWMDRRAERSIHAVVTDPPYGLKEYAEVEKRKLRNGVGGVWRIPPSFDGCRRSPVPRFTVLTDDDLNGMQRFFAAFAERAFRILVPGGHLFIASSPLLSHVVYSQLLKVGFEKRGEIIRLVQTLRGGDRPKNAHVEFSDVTVMPHSGWEPWGLFRNLAAGVFKTIFAVGKQAVFGASPQISRFPMSLPLPQLAGKSGNWLPIPL